MKKFTKEEIDKEINSDKSKEDKVADSTSVHIKSGNEILGLFIVAVGIVIAISLYSYSPSDVPIFHENALGYRHANMIGVIGATIAYFLVYYFGIGAYFWSIFCLVLGFGHLIKIMKSSFRRFIGGLLLVICVISGASAFNLNIRAIYGGGYCGDFLYTNAILYLSVVGSALLWGLALLYSTHLLFNISWFGVAHKTSSVTAKGVSAVNQKVKDKKNKKNNILALEEKPSSLKIEYADDFDTVEDKPKGKSKLKEKMTSLFAKKSKKNDDEPIEIFIDDAIDDDFQEDFDDSLDGAFENFDDVDIIKEADDEFFSVEEKKKSAKATTKEKKSIKDWNLFPKKKEKGQKEVVEQKKAPAELVLPPISLLAQSHSKEIKLSPAVLTEKGERIIKALDNYKIQAKMVRAVPGPVITMYEIQPAAGIRVSKITNLSDELAMNLKSVSVRIQAPIPGSDTVGIEVPNDERADVSFRELIGGADYQDSASMLTMALGKDIKGKPYSADLAKMPHLLIAGATGAGKSVCLNSIIISFLYKAKPDEVKLLLIDPKRIELSMYEGLPHLVHPVVTEMELAKNALQWALEEMNRRFALLRDLTVRNIADYNAKVKKMSKPTPLPKALQPNAEETLYHTHVPYLVIIIDELADLIMTHGKDVESSIVRLAQLARAAGIHIILATQRPSVNVVTGLIKANFPCRISFQVTQKVDSRTILDAQGAETLLGRGDMLFKPGGGKLMRLHGAFIPDDDVNKVVNYWKKQQKPDYSIDFTEYAEAKQEAILDSSNRSDISSEAVYQEAVKILPTMEKVSISALQRKLRVGFNKAALIKEQLEKDGYIQDR